MSGASEERNLTFTNYCRKPDGRRNRGGGVSIVSHDNKISVKKFNVKTAGHEIVAIKGKLPRITRPIFVIGAYISTRLTHQKKAHFIETLVGIILKIKGDAKDPYIVLAGDMNMTDFSPILVDYPDLSVVESGPTRGENCLDIIITNFADCHRGNEIRPPLLNIQSGTVSDHSFPIVTAGLPRVHSFQWVRRRYRPMRQEQIAKAAEHINGIVWEKELPTMNDPDKYVEALHSVIVRTSERFLPWKEDKIRSTDQPWVTSEFRKKVKQRKRIYRRTGRGPPWKKLKRKCDKLKRKARSAFYRREVEKMKQPGIVPFQAIKNIKDSERPEDWALTDLFPGEAESDAMEKAADYFSSIAQEFPPLTQADIPHSYDRPSAVLSVDRVAEVLKDMKKPRSYVSIDPPPQVLKLCIPHIATAITPVMNLIMCSSWWPDIWKQEEVTIIPKTTRPDSLDQTRNISCTSILSKLAETLLLSKLAEEVTLGPDQYGGKKGWGTDHLLCDLVTRMNWGLEDSRGCVNLISLDFSKAFNRMSHARCISMLAKKGASNQSLASVAAFLSNRKIKIKMNGQFSKTRHTPGGAPQGTKLGNILFSFAVEDLDDVCPDVVGPLPAQEVEQSSASINMSAFDSSTNFSMNLAPYDRRLLPRQNPLDDTLPHSLLSAWNAEEINQELGFPDRWLQDKLEQYFYVDDQSFLEVCPTTNAVTAMSTRKEKKFVNPIGLQQKYIRTDRAAADIGMKLNLSKTQLLCYSDATHSDVSSYIAVGGEIIESTDTIKILGYTIGSKPGAHAHIATIKRGVARRTWTIRHLRKAGVPERDLVQIYMAFIRSVIEFASNVYGGFLSETQSDDLERLQANALRAAYGSNMSYRRCLLKSEIPTLRERRHLLFMRFTKKILKNTHFRNRWLPENDPIKYSLRHVEKYKIGKLRCERMEKTPIIRMRRLLNDLDRRGTTIDEEIECFEEFLKNVQRHNNMS